MGPGSSAAVSLNQYINQILAMAMGRRAAPERQQKPRSTASALVR
jgi:hypothetical protein